MSCYGDCASSAIRCDGSDAVGDVTRFLRAKRSVVPYDVFFNRRYERHAIKVEHDSYQTFPDLGFLNGLADYRVDERFEM